MKRPTPLFGATPEQAEHFLTLYRSATLRAAAAEAGLNIIQATMIARHSGCLRITEAAIVNSKHGEIGRMGEEIFQQHFPEAVNCNTSVAQNNPAYDFVLNGMRIDIKTSCLSASGRGKNRKIRFRCDNKFDTDLFIIIVKQDSAAAVHDHAAYRHCFIIPSLMLLNHVKIEIIESVLRGDNAAWAEYLFPIEKMRETVMMMAENPEMLTIPPELAECAQLNRKIKKEVKNAKPERHRTTA